jgi:hypothetical protein
MLHLKKLQIWLTSAENICQFARKSKSTFIFAGDVKSISERSLRVKWRLAIITSCQSVRPSVSIYQRRSNWANFLEI